MKCINCKKLLTRWRTKSGFEGLSGWTCECGMSHTIDQYPNDLQTQELRIMLSKKVNTKGFNEIDWANLERKYNYGI